MWRYLVTNFGNKNFIDVLNMYSSNENMKFQPMGYYPAESRVASYRGTVPKIKTKSNESNSKLALKNKSKRVKKEKFGTKLLNSKKLILKYQSGTPKYGIRVNDPQSNEFFYTDFVPRLIQTRPDLTEQEIARI
jgi:hypothetical protein